LLFLTAALGSAAAQSAPSSPLGSSAPVSGGGVEGLKAPTPFAGIPSAGAKAHLGPDGKPCLTVSGDAMPETFNPHIFKHLIVANNGCTVPIRIQVCYYDSLSCTQMSVPPDGRSETVLGIMPAMSKFRFEYHEQFDGMSPMGFRFK
jgi:hypothetical protein